MADFRREVARTRGRGTGIIDTSVRSRVGEAIGAGIANVTNAAVEAQTQVVTANLDDRVQSAVDATDRESGIFEAVADEGLPDFDPAVAPEDVEYLNQLELAKEQGSVSKFGFNVALSKKIREIKASRPGFHDEIDQMVAKHLGNDAERVIRNEVFDAAKSQKDAESANRLRIRKGLEEAGLWTKSFEDDPDIAEALLMRTVNAEVTQKKRMGDMEEKLKMKQITEAEVEVEAKIQKDKVIREFTDTTIATFMINLADLAKTRKFGPEDIADLRRDFSSKFQESVQRFDPDNTKFSNEDRDAMYKTSEQLWNSALSSAGLGPDTAEVYENYGKAIAAQTTAAMLSNSDVARVVALESLVPGITDQGVFADLRLATSKYLASDEESRLFFESQPEYGGNPLNSSRGAIGAQLHMAEGGILPETLDLTTMVKARGEDTAAFNARVAKTSSSIRDSAFMSIDMISSGKDTDPERISAALNNLVHVGVQSAIFGNDADKDKHFATISNPVFMKAAMAADPETTKRYVDKVLHQQRATLVRDVKGFAEKSGILYDAGQGGFIVAQVEKTFADGSKTYSEPTIGQVKIKDKLNKALRAQQIRADVEGVPVEVLQQVFIEATGIPSTLPAENVQAILDSQIDTPVTKGLSQRGRLDMPVETKVIGPQEDALPGDTRSFVRKLIEDRPFKEQLARSDETPFSKQEATLDRFRREERERAVSRTPINFGVESPTLKNMTFVEPNTPTQAPTLTEGITNVVATVMDKVGSDFIRKYESVEKDPSNPALHILYDANGMGDMTIGYGHKVKKGEKFTTITEAEALALWEQDTAIAEADVDALITVPLNQNQRNALVSLVFNVGRSKLKGSNTIALINSGGSEADIRREWSEWRKSNGKVMGGLVDRRKEELDIYFA